MKFQLVRMHNYLGVSVMGEVLTPIAYFARSEEYSRLCVHNFPGGVDRDYLNQAYQIKERVVL